MPRQITAFWGEVRGLWPHCLPVARIVPHATTAIASLGDACTPTLVCWQDAAGAFRLIAAVVYGPNGLFFVRAKVPGWLWCQFLPRRDDQLGVQEALAVWLLLTDFKKLLGGTLFTPDVDNDRLTAEILKVSYDSPEANFTAAIFWFRFKGALIPHELSG